LAFKILFQARQRFSDGFYTGKILGTPALGEGKLKKVEEWAYKKNISITEGSTFYSDSINDFPLLKRC
jgi:phosphoserine phosphatase